MTPTPPAPGPAADEPSRPADAGCLSRLSTAILELTGVRRRVAEKVLADPWAVQGMSINRLAEWAGASENAISRLTNSLGYSGYREFMQALSMDLGKSLGYYHVHPAELVEQTESSDEGMLGLVRRVVGLEISCLQDTLANLSEPTLHHAVQALAQARHVTLIGTGTAAPLCHLGTYRLVSSGLSASWTADGMMMIAEMSRLGPDDVVLAISYSGRSRDTVQAATFARSRGARLVALSTNPQSPLANVADVCLTIFSARVSEENAQFGARVAGLALLEAIATAVSVERDTDGTGVAALKQLGAAQDRWNTLPTDWRA